MSSEAPKGRSRDISCTISCLLFLLFLFVCNCSVFPQEKPSAGKTAAVIADRIMAETSYTFTNSKTKETYANLKNVPFSMDIQVTNEYNEWHYTNGVLHIALLELADWANNQKYEEYVWKNMQFVFDKDNLAFFEKQYRQAFQANRWKGVRGQSWHMIFRNKRLDDNGPMGASLIELQMKRPDDAFLRYIQATENHLMHAEPRLSDGTIARLWPHENTIWADDLFMAVSFLSRMGKMTGDTKYFDDAVNQALNYHTYLWHPAKEIYYHCYHTDVKEHGVAHWSRANGWMLMAKADLLSVLPKNHPQRAALIENFNTQVQGILQ
ncbi:MAG: glycoside hydrolase family 88 protein, partial [Tannerella sp.]|nr:glycoside hydrolase family 88 protein [Tannerella sp.]